MTKYFFPFGQELKKVQQEDRIPKKVFVLGVYASAVHACWLDANGKQKVAALAVASEPIIFWTGDNAENIISSIQIPKSLGKLTLPQNMNLNGPSGRALDDFFLKPLGFSRNDAWLCDLLPESRVNENQKKAIDDHYNTNIIQKYNLNEASIPLFNKSELDSYSRRQEILDELETSKAETVILLGDLPIFWFLRFHDKRYSKLTQFGDTIKAYGCTHEIKINNKNYQVIPLCHPRQAQRLGNASAKWSELHDNWIKMKPVNNIR